MFMYNIVSWLTCYPANTRSDCEYFVCNSAEFVYLFESIIHAFKNKVID